jgi:hypothetical protein
MEAMPREFNLTAPATMPQARTYMFKRQSDLQTYDLAKGNRIRVNIPRLQRTYLNKGTYLRFRLNLDIASTANKGICFDRCGAYGLFDRMEVYDYLGGTLIEQVQNIPALTVLLNDINLGFTDLNGKRQATEGFSGSGIHVVSPPTTQPLDTQAEVCTAQVGAFVYNKTDTDGNNNGQFVTKEYTIHLPSFLDMFSDKYVPLHNGFSIDLYLNSPEQAFVSRQTSQLPGSIKLDNSWLSNVELCCQVTELGDYAERLMLSTSDPWVIHSKFYRYFSDMITAKSEDGNKPLTGDVAVSQSSFRLDLNLNVVSLRNIFFGMRPRYYQNKIEFPSYGHRIRNYLENFNFQYGSSYLPEISGVQCRAVTVPSSLKGYASTCSTTATISDVDRYPTGASPLADTFCQALEELSKTSNKKYPSIEPEEFRIDSGSGQYGSASNGRLDQYVPYRWDSNTRCGKFAGGLNVQLSQRGAVCGLDTNGLSLSINGTFNADAASATAPNITDTSPIPATTITPMVYAILDCWAEHDAFVQVIPGVATTVTF